jgi:hypothetical protein
LGERAPELIGGIAAGRPLLSSAVIVFGLSALTAQAFKDASVSFGNASIAFMAALTAMVVLPAALAAIAPRNFWLRVLYASFAAGIFLAARRILAQAEFPVGPIDPDVALGVAAGAIFLLCAGAPLWRAALSLSMIGLAAIVLGASAGLSMTAIESGLSGAVATAGASLGLAAAAGAAICVSLAARFSRAFAEGGDNFSAAAEAARGAAAPALFAIGVGVMAMVFAARGDSGSLGAALAAARVSAVAMAASLTAPLFMLTAALALKARTEATAVRENRRRALLEPMLSLFRKGLAPSSALAASAILIIVAIVAGFETATAASAGEYAVVAAVSLVAAVVFVSLRTALMIAALLLVAGRLAHWGGDLAGFPELTETARVAASALAALLYAELALAWRDRRNPRRKTREVVQMALADSYFAYAASSIVAASALAATEAAGLWSEGVEASLHVGALALIGLVAAPPLMTAVGALFGRD